MIVASLPERAELRTEMLATVDAQLERPAAVLVELDEHHEGPIALYNRLAEEVTTPWLFPFADDDLLEPDHFKVLGEACAGVDRRTAVVYTWCWFEHPDCERDHWQRDPHKQPNGIYALRLHNFIPAPAAIRTDVWRELGGYHDPGIMRHEDWHLWCRILNAGGGFECVPQVTWTYRTGNWQHHSTR